MKLIRITFAPSLLTLGLLAVATAATAQERIKSYDVDLSIQPDGGLNVTETITVHAEGENIRRGIYRDFPTRYKDRYGNRVVVDFKPLAVERDGATEPWFTENKDNGVRINTGNDNYLPVPADFTYTLRYRTTRQIGFFGDHDELYFNAIGTGWEFAIERAHIVVHLPKTVPTEQLQVEGFTGYQGYTEKNFRAEATELGTGEWTLRGALLPRQGFTIVFSFPKGIVTQPTSAQRWRWFFGDNGGVLIALVGLLALLLYCVRTWHRIGRDPAKGVIIARYDPPEKRSPASLRYLRRMGYDTRCFSSDVLALAVARTLSITQKDGFLSKSWQIERERPTATTPALTLPQQDLLDGLFDGGISMLELKSSNATHIQAARAMHEKALKATLQPDYFRLNGGSVFLAALIAVVSGGLAFLVARDGGGVPIIIGIGALMVITLVAFGFLVRAPTLAGRKLLDEIEGLKLYLSVAERDELARMQEPREAAAASLLRRQESGAPPALDAERYEKLLPYAVALEVEEAWTDKFTAAVGAAAAAQATSHMTWYRGDVGDLGSLSRAVGESFSSTIASASSPPGSSSGSGGSSGGGGGGGGGGGR
jgi:uncharacterized membrane protein YgcG